MPNTPPLILTLALDAAAEHFFNALRLEHFPAERNFLNAHLTLFHQLPPQQPQLVQDIQAVCAQQKILPLQVVRVASMGNGVAYGLESAALQQLHKKLQQQWQAWLVPQDRHTLWPHITVQNKVTPQAAQALLQQLQALFTPFYVQATGLRLWKYLGGPWEPVQTFWFNLEES